MITNQGNGGWLRKCLILKQIQYKPATPTNAKGTSLSGKHKRRKGPTKANPKQLRKWS